MAANTDHPVDFGAGMLMAPVPLGDWLVILPIIITLVGGAVILMMRLRPKYHGVMACGFLSLLLLADLLLLLRVMKNGPISMTMGGWLPPFGISFTVDAFGALMATISAIVALAVCVYSLIDIPPTGRRFGFYPFLLVMMTGVSGSFLTGDLFNLYVWFEVLLISSFGLIVLGGERDQIDGALKYAVLNLTATTLFLIAVGLLYGAVGTLNMADIATIVRAMPKGEAPLASIGALFFFAFCMKAAAFPVNFWLPASYHTPRIVVSAVFAGLLTKVGVYALIRTMLLLLPDTLGELGGVPLLIAVLTMLLGALGALAQNDVRRLFGYLVISGIGSMLAGLAIGTESSLTGAILYAVHSIIVMTALYLVFGILMRMSGGRSTLSELGGGYTASGWLSILFLVLAFAVSGLPPFSGFWPKLVLVEASLNEAQGWVTFAILLTGFLTTIAMGRVWAHAFWRGGPIGTEDGRDAAPLNQLAESVVKKAFLPVTALVVLVCIIGLFPSPLYSIARTGAASLLKPDRYVESVFGAARQQMLERALRPATEHEDQQEGAH
ncbi:multicomponent Na+:H+ antiporter subunit D [Cohaesibacter sp. ES.047]|uniref:Na+/H+ antiporter subunit D n=1 Tax=Cohaesibacter sp. ES.047 TaxID=1798205 RepID=UPI000BB90FBA|nr:Na+/H+ antiporter subunit D [Cohaesibacter sp. ES.047]SNY92771.1 multicomponent Na+:H+ antiporter subunit D [Cohaesibacter sp. ES.047]